MSSYKLQLQDGKYLYTFNDETKNTACLTDGKGRESKESLLQGAQSGDYECIAKLLLDGSRYSTDWLGFTPLHYAAKFNYPDILKLCVSVNVRCKLNRTPLHLAAYYGHVECVKVLLSKNASVDSMDTLHMTALHWAAYNGFMEIVTILLSAEANPYLLNRYFKSPSELALMAGHRDIYTFLEHYDTKNSLQEPAEVNASFENSSYTQSDVVGDQSEKLNRSITTNSFSSDKQTSDLEMKKLIENNGIKKLPVDGSTVLTSAVTDGHRLVLTGAGKLVLKSTSGDILREFIIENLPRNGTTNQNIVNAKRMAINEDVTNEHLLTEENTIQKSVSKCDDATKHSGIRVKITKAALDKINQNGKVIAARGLLLTDSEEKTIHFKVSNANSNSCSENYINCSSSDRVYDDSSDDVDNSENMIKSDINENVSFSTDNAPIGPDLKRQRRNLGENCPTIKRAKNEINPEEKDSATIKKKGKTFKDDRSDTIHRKTAYNCDGETDNSSRKRNIKNDADPKMMRLLEEHGIKELPVDESPLVTSAIKSGQKIVLTDAGKLALEQTKRDVIKEYIIAQNNFNRFSQRNRAKRKKKDVINSRNQTDGGNKSMKENFSNVMDGKESKIRSADNRIEEDRHPSAEFNQYGQIDEKSSKSSISSTNVNFIDEESDGSVFNFNHVDIGSEKNISETTMKQDVSQCSNTNNMIAELRDCITSDDLTDYNFTSSEDNSFGNSYSDAYGNGTVNYRYDIDPDSDRHINDINTMADITAGTNFTTTHSTVSHETDGDGLLFTLNRNLHTENDTSSSVSDFTHTRSQFNNETGSDNKNLNNNNNLIITSALNSNISSSEDSNLLSKQLFGTNDEAVFEREEGEEESIEDLLSNVLNDIIIDRNNAAVDNIDPTFQLEDSAVIDSCFAADKCNIANNNNNNNNNLSTNFTTNRETSSNDDEILRRLLAYNRPPTHVAATAAAAATTQDNVRINSNSEISKKYVISNKRPIDDEIRHLNRSKPFDCRTTSSIIISNSKIDTSSGGLVLNSSKNLNFNRYNDQMNSSQLLANLLPSSSSSSSRKERNTYSTCSASFHDNSTLPSYDVRRLFLQNGIGNKNKLSEFRSKNLNDYLTKAIDTDNYVNTTTVKCDNIDQNAAVVPLTSSSDETFHLIFNDNENCNFDNATNNNNNNNCNNLDSVALCNENCDNIGQKNALITSNVVDAFDLDFDDNRNCNFDCSIKYNTYRNDNDNNSQSMHSANKNGIFNPNTAVPLMPSNFDNAINNNNNNSNNSDSSSVCHQTYTGTTDCVLSKNNVKTNELYNVTDDYFKYTNDSNISEKNKFKSAVDSETSVIMGINNYYSNNNSEFNESVNFGNNCKYIDSDNNDVATIVNNEIIPKSVVNCSAAVKSGGAEIDASNIDNYKPNTNNYNFNETIVTANDSIITMNDTDIQNNHRNEVNGSNINNSIGVVDGVEIVHEQQSVGICVRSIGRIATSTSYYKPANKPIRLRIRPIEGIVGPGKSSVSNL